MSIRTLTLALAFLLLAAPLLRADEQKLGDSTKSSTAEIVSAVGLTLPQVWERFGLPFDVRVFHDAKPDSDSVTFDYNDFVVRLRGGSVVCVVFLPNYNGPIQGIKMGLTRQEVIAQLGNKYDKDPNSEGHGDDLVWDVPDSKSEIWVLFDKDDKVHFVQINPR